MSPVKICPGCDACEEQPHHWIAYVDDDGVPGFLCKHCPQTQTLDVHYHPEFEEAGLAAPEVRLVRYYDDGHRRVESSWRSCMWCGGALTESASGAVCGRGRCVVRERRYLEKHPNEAPREERTIINERYL